MRYSITLQFIAPMMMGFTPYWCRWEPTTDLDGNPTRYAAPYLCHNAVYYLYGILATDKKIQAVITSTEPSHGQAYKCYLRTHGVVLVCLTKTVESLSLTAEAYNWLNDRIDDLTKPFWVTVYGWDEEES